MIYVKKHDPVPEGSVAVVGAGNLKAKYVIHAVGLVYGVLKEIINYTQRLSPHWKKS